MTRHGTVFALDLEFTVKLR